MDIESEFDQSDHNSGSAPKFAPKSAPGFTASMVEKQRSGLKAQLVSLDKMMKHISLQRQIVQGMLDALPPVVADAAVSSKEPSPSHVSCSPTPVVNNAANVEMSPKMSPEASIFVSAHDDSHAMEDVNAVVDSICRANVDVVLHAADDLEHTVEVGNGIEDLGVDDAAPEVSSHPLK